MIEETETIQGQEVDLRSYLRVITKRRWTILTFFIVVVLSVAIYTFTATPIYQATARIVIEKENQNVVSIHEVLAVDSTGQDYYQTQYKIIESRSVAREVIKRLHLDQNPEFLPEPAEGLRVGNMAQTLSALGDAIEEALNELCVLDTQALLDLRYRKYRSVGVPR